LKHRIVKMTEDRVGAYRAAFDQVARERRYFPQLKAPPLKDMRAFVRGILRAKDLQFVAMVGDKVVGWCDIVSGRHDAKRHSGVLAIGVVLEYRGRGIGSDLMMRAIASARRRHLTRIELTVRADNRAAIALYKSMGFKPEGVHRNAIRIDGKYFDQLAMALIDHNAA
jgi:ribosomal protein S18 acetylase RimI-like enzyme